MSGVRFTEERRAAWLSLVRSGATQEIANREVGVSTATVRRWLDLGRAETSGARADFARAFDGIGGGEDCEPLDESELVRLLERQARRGSVSAIRLLLERQAASDEVSCAAEPAMDRGREILAEMARRRYAHRV